MKITLPPMVVVLLYCFGVQQFFGLVARSVYRVMEWAQWPADASYLIVYLCACLALALPPAGWLMFKLFFAPRRSATGGVA